MGTPKRGIGSVYRRPDSPYWWISYYRNGKSYRESTGLQHTNFSGQLVNANKAERKLQDRMAESRTESFVEPKAHRTLVSELADDLLRDYRINGRKSLDDVKARWNLHLKPFLGNYRAVQVTSDLLNRYVDQRQQERASNATINRELAALKRAFNLALRSTPPKVGKVLHFPHLAERNVRTGFVGDADYATLAREFGKTGLWMRALFECGYSYGWREGELLNLRVAQVNVHDRVIRLNPGETKNDDGRVVTMTEAIFMLLSCCVSGKNADDHVFTRENGESVRDFRDAWAKGCCAAGVGKLLCPQCSTAVLTDFSCATCERKWNRTQLRYSGLIFHDLRRSAVRNMVRAGIPEKQAMLISGHRTRSIFDRYAIFNERDIQDAVHKLEKYRAEHSRNIHVEVSTESHREERSVVSN